MTLSAFAGGTLLNQSLTVTLPPMKFFNHTFEEKLATDQRLTYQLDKVVNATKDDKQDFQINYRTSFVRRFVDTFGFFSPHQVI